MAQSFMESLHPGQTKDAASHALGTDTNSLFVGLYQSLKAGGSAGADTQSAPECTAGANGIIPEIMRKHGMLPSIMRHDCGEKKPGEFPGLGISQIDLGKLGFPHPDLTGFDQESHDPSEGTFEKIWRGVKGFFGYEETVEDRLKEKILKGLTPEEQKQYEAEQKALDEYHRPDMTLAMIHAGRDREMPATPMHDEVNKRLKQAEKQITDSVRSEMSEHDQKRLDQKMKDYAKLYKETMTIKNPYGTGEGFKTPPEPPVAVKDYYERIAEAAEKYAYKKKPA